MVQPHSKPISSLARYGRNLRKHADLYLLLLPALAALIIFKYVPMAGIQIAFRKYNIFAGMAASPWVGFDNFRRLFSSSEFLNVLSNTLIISAYKIAILFPMGVIIALLLNEIHHMTYKRVVQTVIYIPHFFSWVVVAGLFSTILSSTGLMNKLLESLGANRINFMVSPSWFRAILVFSAGWKECGWNAIVFIAAIAGIDQQMYEAARIDGAGRVRQIISITIPSIMPTVILMLILRIGNLMTAGTQQVLVMYNPVVYDVADVLGTYIYRMGIGKMEYSFSTAVGLFESVVGFGLVVMCNSLSRKFVGSSIW
jgi:ABC-type polysaccharide transport system, permease component